MKLLVGMSGSIGILYMPSFLQVLRQRYPQLKVIMTDAAKEFISEAALSLIAPEVYSRLFPFSPREKEGFHVQLARWADLMIILPATANILAEAAHGMSRSLLTTTLLCHSKPVLFFPNMNSAMWNNPATQRNVGLLREYGHTIIPPVQQMGFEYSSGQFKEGEIMPGFDKILEILQEEVRLRTGEEVLEETWLSTP